MTSRDPEGQGRDPGSVLQTSQDSVVGVSGTPIGRKGQERSRNPNALEG